MRTGSIIINVPRELIRNPEPDSHQIEVWFDILKSSAVMGIVAGAMTCGKESFSGGINKSAPC
jgi:hypothetical protein